MAGIIIQARMGSTRLAGKVLMNIGGKNLLEHIFYRLTFLKHPATIVLATSRNPIDDVIEEFCTAKGVEIFREVRWMYLRGTIYAQRNTVLDI